jgi:hypothetical protein
MGSRREPVGHNQHHPPLRASDGLIERKVRGPSRWRASIGRRPRRTRRFDGRRGSARRRDMHHAPCLLAPAGTCPSAGAGGQVRQLGSRPARLPSHDHLSPCVRAKRLVARCHIVNISSIEGLLEGGSVYGMTKHAVQPADPPFLLSAPQPATRRALVNHRCAHGAMPCAARRASHRRLLHRRRSSRFRRACTKSWRRPTCTCTWSAPASSTPSSSSRRCR